MKCLRCSFKRVGYCHFVYSHVPLLSLAVWFAHFVSQHRVSNDMVSGWYIFKEVNRAKEQKDLVVTICHPTSLCAHPLTVSIDPPTPWVITWLSNTA